MNEDALRDLIRHSIARHLGGVQEPQRQAVPQVPVSFLSHASHYRYGGLPKSGDACVIEPAVTCNHCGYCESHGH
jgi:hypothetical protein